MNLFAVSTLLTILLHLANAKLEMVYAVIRHGATSPAEQNKFEFQGTNWTTISDLTAIGMR